MKLYKKIGNTLHILSFPGENVEKGGYIISKDIRVGKSLIAQIIDIQFANIPGVMEELLRSPDSRSSIDGEDADPLDIMSHILFIQDVKELICKIHGTYMNEVFNQENSWLPSRTHSDTHKLPTDCLIKMAKMKELLPIDLGETQEATSFSIDATNLDGKLNIITGKKGTGKSYLSKIIVLGLVGYGATVVVLDLNGEYTSLGYDKDGKKNEYYDRIHVLSPSESFKVTLEQTNLYVMLKILIYSLSLPGTSTREFKHIWQFLRQNGNLRLSELGTAIRHWKCNQHVKDAIYSRYFTIANSGFFTDKLSEATDMEELLLSTQAQGGGTIIINLSNTSPTTRKMVVEYVLAKLQDSLSKRKIRAVFLFAEEAHLYLRETYWDDIVTRMRHFGIFTTFITNQPNTIHENIYRQADNVFLLNFVNKHDIEIVSRAARVDSDTIASIVFDLPPYYCLVLGKVVKDLPIIVKVKYLNIRTLGQTRFFFNKGPATQLNIQGNTHSISSI